MHGSSRRDQSLSTAHGHSYRDTRVLERLAIGKRMEWRSAECGRRTGSAAVSEDVELFLPLRARGVTGAAVDLHWRQNLRIADGWFPQAPLPRRYLGENVARHV